MTNTAEDRQRHIVRTARATGSVDVNALAAELGVAKETVRRDLRALEDHGLVRRTHGGAYPVESAGFETTLAFRAATSGPICRPRDTSPGSVASPRSPTTRSGKASACGG
jgi:DNA-binding Lrp family transcriptional regulator